MDDKVFRVALASLTQDFEKEVRKTDMRKEEVRKTDMRKEEPAKKDKADVMSIIYKGLDLIQHKKIKDIKNFNEYLTRANVDQKEFADAVMAIIDQKKPERLVQLGMFLGEGVKGSGLDLLKRSWWERNFHDEILKKVLAPQWWKLFRDEKWLQENKVTKD